MGESLMLNSEEFASDQTRIGLRGAPVARVVGVSRLPAATSFMPTRKFLVVDDNHDSRFLLTKTLLRRFPQAVVQECQESEPAQSEARSGELDAIIAHRASDMDGLTLIRSLRRVNATIPIVMVSGIDRTAQALEAGATEFLNYDQWQRIGLVVAARFGAVNAA
jgi:CheY-like chemotaxis protein